MDDTYPDWLMRRFWAKVDRRDDDECWLWTASLTGGGYGQFWDAVRRVRRDAHRFVYEALVGPIPDGLQLDHVKARGCTSRACVNPVHLEPVTRAENLRRGDGFGGINSRKVVCIHGHELAGDNLYVDPRGRRQCKACRAAQQKEFRARNPTYQTEYARKRKAAA
jgi:hypothetical protein